MFYRILGMAGFVLCLVGAYGFLKAASTGSLLMIDFIYSLPAANQVGILSIFLIGSFMGLYCICAAAYECIRLMRK